MLHHLIYIGFLSVHSELCNPFVARGYIMWNPFSAQGHPVRKYAWIRIVSNGIFSRDGFPDNSAKAIYIGKKNSNKTRTCPTVALEGANRIILESFKVFSCWCPTNLELTVSFLTYLELAVFPSPIRGTNKANLIPGNRWNFDIFPLPALSKSNTN